MPRVNFVTSDFRRRVSGAPSLILKNRYFEKNPALTTDGASLLARPGMRKLVDVGTGPIRGLYSAAGAFRSDLFIASGAALHRMSSSLVQETIYEGLFNPDRGVVNMTITGKIGETPEFLFVADGSTLFVYMENGYAKNRLIGAPANADVIRIGGTYYRFTNASVDTGTPAGTSANPWLVSLGATPTQAFTNFYDAIGLNGAAGVQYSTATTANPDVKAIEYSGTGVTVQSFEIGGAGNTTITTETGAALEWQNGGTLSGGGDPSVTGVPLPDNIGAIDVAVISSYVIVIPVQEGEFVGRVYWIEPGETTIDPLNFITAERSPDGVFGVEVFGDQFWLPGESTTEVWYVTGDIDVPMRKQQGIVLDRGSWQNTATAIHETLMLVDNNGGVFSFQGGSPKRVSSPDIEEEIRRAISLQQSFLV